LLLSPASIGCPPWLVGCRDDEAPCVSAEEETVVLKVTVRFGAAGAVLFVLLPPDMDDINGVVSVEPDAIAILWLLNLLCRGNWTI
jgi:hypothetical protein